MKTHSGCGGYFQDIIFFKVILYKIKKSKVLFFFSLEKFAQISPTNFSLEIHLLSYVEIFLNGVKSFLIENLQIGQSLFKSAT